jgi:hypothetical protein
MPLGSAWIFHTCIKLTGRLGYRTEMMTVRFWSGPGVTLNDFAASLLTLPNWRTVVCLRTDWA